MKLTLLNFLVIVALGLCAHAEAQSLNFTLTAPNVSGGTSTVSGSNRTDRFVAGSSKVGNTTQSGGTTYTLVATFTGPTGSQPASLTMTYNAQLNGYFQYNLIGTPSPSGSCTGDYSETVTQGGGGASTTLTDSYSVTQGTDPKNGTINSTPKNLTGQVVSTPVDQWTASNTHNGITTYTISKSVILLSATTSASAPVPDPRSPNSSTSTCYFLIDLGGVTVTAGP